MCAVCTTCVCFVCTCVCVRVCVCVCVCVKQEREERRKGEARLREHHPPNHSATAVRWEGEALQPPPAIAPICQAPVLSLLRCCAPAQPSLLAAPPTSPTPCLHPSPLPPRAAPSLLPPPPPRGGTALGRPSPCRTPGRWTRTATPPHPPPAPLHGAWCKWSHPPFAAWEVGGVCVCVCVCVCWQAGVRVQIGKHTGKGDWGHEGNVKV